MWLAFVPEGIVHLGPGSLMVVTQSSTMFGGCLMSLVCAVALF